MICSFERWGLLDKIKNNNKDVGLGGVCFFHLMLNRTFFELNTE